MTYSNICLIYCPSQCLLQHRCSRRWGHFVWH